MAWYELHSKLAVLERELLDQMGQYLDRTGLAADDHGRLRPHRTSVDAPIIPRESVPAFQQIYDKFLADLHVMMTAFESYSSLDAAPYDQMISLLGAHGDTAGQTWTAYGQISLVKARDYLGGDVNSLVLGEDWVGEAAGHFHDYLTNFVTTVDRQLDAVREYAAIVETYHQQTLAVQKDLITLLDHGLRTLRGPDHTDPMAVLDVFAVGVAVADICLEPPATVAGAVTAGLGLGITSGTLLHDIFGAWDRDAEPFGLSRGFPWETLASILAVLKTIDQQARDTDDNLSQEVDVDLQPGETFGTDITPTRPDTSFSRLQNDTDPVTSIKNDRIVVKLVHLEELGRRYLPDTAQLYEQARALVAQSGPAPGGDYVQHWSTSRAGAVKAHANLVDALAHSGALLDDAAAKVRSTAERYRLSDERGRAVFQRINEEFPSSQAAAGEPPAGYPI